MKKKIKLITSRLLVVLCMVAAVSNVMAQNTLLVHPAEGGSAKSFSLDNIQKITFSGDNMLLKTTDGNETFPLANVGKITFGEIMGIPVLSRTPEISIYPNPAVDYTRVDSPVEIKSWTLLNMNGKALKHSVFNLQIPVSDLPTGIYLLRLNTDNGSVTKKFIKR